MGSVECPRCGRTTEAAGIWLWVNGMGERLTIEEGRIQQSGHVDVFDLACGCKFDTHLWELRIRSSVTLQRGGSVEVRVVPILDPLDEAPGGFYHSLVRLPGKAEKPGRDGLMWFACDCPIGQDHDIDGRVR